MLSMIKVPFFITCRNGATFLIPSQGSWRHSVHYDWGSTLDGFALSTSLLP
jgi:hypothetical protein